jgi:phosphoribosyl-AMP cyclohydrolase
MKRNVSKPNFEKRGGLITAIVQNVKTGQILMVAYSDEAGWLKTLETGLVSLYSTSRQKSWVKGEESGNFMMVMGYTIDCDGDAVIYLVEPCGNGLACHTDAVSCFYRGLSDQICPAPKAGENEELPLVEVEVHERLRDIS